METHCETQAYLSPLMRPALMRFALDGLPKTYAVRAWLRLCHKITVKELA